MKNLTICTKCKAMAEIEKTPIVGDFIRCNKCNNRDVVLMVDLDDAFDRCNLIFTKPAPKEEMELVIPNFKCPGGCGWIENGINAKLGDSRVCPACSTKWVVVNSKIEANKLAWDTSYGTYTQFETISVPKKKEEPKPEQKENRLEKWECPYCGDTNSCWIYGRGTVRCHNNNCDEAFTAHFSQSAQQFYLKTMASTATYTVDGGIFDEDYFPRYTGPCKKTQFVDWTCVNCGMNHHDTRVLETDTTCSCSNCNKTFKVERDIHTKKAEVGFLELEIPKQTTALKPAKTEDQLSALDRLGDIALSMLNDMIKELEPAPKKASEPLSPKQPYIVKSFYNTEGKVTYGVGADGALYTVKLFAPNGQYNWACIAYPE